MYCHATRIQQCIHVVYVLFYTYMFHVHYFQQDWTLDRRLSDKIKTAVTCVDVMDGVLISSSLNKIVRCYDIKVLRVPYMDTVTVFDTLFILTVNSFVICRP